MYKVKPLILCDKQLPSPAKVRLADFGEVIDLSTENITYAAISGHPDVFCCPVGETLVVSPALLKEYTEIFTVNAIKWVFGAKPNGFSYPNSACYNAVVTDHFLIHNLTITDPKILELAGTRKQIHVNQGYTRCNLLPLPDNIFITSDNGIHAVLSREGIEVLYVNPQGIQLKGFPHGFIGGVCGVSGRNILITGNLSKYTEGQKIRDFLSLHSLTPVELYDGPLIDGGSIFLIKKY
jgi:hypothetical protein